MDKVDKEDVIRVERTKALHELVEIHKNDSEEDEVNSSVTEPSSAYQTASSCEGSESETESAINFNTANPNVLKLTKMKWLTEDQDGAPNSSTTSLASNLSSTSTISHESDMSIGDKHLSTILRLDREHNMFGLFAVVGSKMSKKMKKDDEKPDFPQSAIVQVCCKQSCCRNRSKTDLPASLKCGGGGHTCCVDSICPICSGPCDSICPDPPPCQYMAPCKPKACTTCYGMKITLNPKPKYEPAPVEITPRSSSILHKPLAARSCHHLPRCVPPSSWFPWLMPCFWLGRPGAPCCEPSRCFHNPPCRAPRRRKPCKDHRSSCPPGKCENPAKNSRCTNLLCPGVYTNCLLCGQIICYDKPTNEGSIPKEVWRKGLKMVRSEDKILVYFSK